MTNDFIDFQIQKNLKNPEILSFPDQILITQDVLVFVDDCYLNFLKLEDSNGDTNLIVEKKEFIADKKVIYLGVQENINNKNQYWMMFHCGGKIHIHLRQKNSHIILEQFYEKIGKEFSIQYMNDDGNVYFYCIDHQSQFFLFQLDQDKKQLKKILLQKFNYTFGLFAQQFVRNNQLYVLKKQGKIFSVLVYKLPQLIQETMEEEIIKQYEEYFFEDQEEKKTKFIDLSIFYITKDMKLVLMESPNKSNIIKFFSFTKNNTLQVDNYYEKNIQVVIKIFEHQNQFVIVEPYSVLILENNKIIDRIEDKQKFNELHKFEIVDVFVFQGVFFALSLNELFNLKQSNKNYFCFEEVIEEVYDLN